MNVTTDMCVVMPKTEELTLYENLSARKLQKIKPDSKNAVADSDTMWTKFSALIISKPIGYR